MLSFPKAAGGILLDSEEHSDGHMVSVQLVEGDAEAVTKIREFLKQASRPRLCWP